MRSQIPAALFMIGMIEFHVDPAEERTLLLLTAQDRCQTVTSTGEILRDLPGWRLSRAFFDTFVGMQALQMKRPPRQIVLGRRDGFETVDRGALCCRDTTDRSMLSLTVEFGSDEGPELLVDRASLGAMVRNVHRRGHAGPTRRTGDAFVGELPESWWTIAATDHVIAHLPCSCCGELAWTPSRSRRASQQQARGQAATGFHCAPVPISHSMPQPARQPSTIVNNVLKKSPAP